MGVPMIAFRPSSKQNRPQEEQQPPTTAPVQKSKKKKKKSRNSDQSPNGLSPVAQSDPSPVASCEMKGLSDNKTGSCASLSDGSEKVKNKTDRATDETKNKTGSSDGSDVMKHKTEGIGGSSDGSDETEFKAGTFGLFDRSMGGSSEIENKTSSGTRSSHASDVKTGTLRYTGEKMPTLKTETFSLSTDGIEYNTRNLSLGTRSSHESDVKTGTLSWSDRSIPTLSSATALFSPSSNGSDQTRNKTGILSLFSAGDKMPTLSSAAAPFSRSSHGSDEAKNKTGALSWFDRSIHGSDETRNLSSGTVLSSRPPYRSDERKNDTGKPSFSDRSTDGSDETRNRNLAAQSGRSSYGSNLMSLSSGNAVSEPETPSGRSSDGSEEIHGKTQICNMGVALHNRSSSGSDEMQRKMQNVAHIDRCPIQRTVSDGLFSYRQHVFKYETNQTRPLDFQPTLAAMNSACSFARRRRASSSADVEKFLAAAEPRMIDLLSSTRQYGKKCSCWSFKFCKSLDKVALKAVWEWYEEPSICGIKVSSCGKGDEMYDGYFVPYISAIRIFGTDKELLYEFFETTSPTQRLPFQQRIHELTEGKMGSCTTTGDPTVLYRLLLGNVHAASWYAVAWYPIYKIPDGPFRSTFLTYHSLAHFQADGDVILLPVLGLQTYNCQVDKWFMEVPKERCESLEEAAGIFSRGLLADFKHSDYEFFTARKL